jgi:osmotically-inducible protein OsmY
MTQNPFHPIDDIELAAAIAASMQLNGETPDVTVDVTDGVVTLEGMVEHAQQRDAAEDVVRRFRVRGVINTLTLRPRPGST